MSRHFEQAPGLCEQPDATTAAYRFTQTMLRIKDPAPSLDFYTRVIGMRLVRKLDFPEMKFTLYFLGCLDDQSAATIPAEEHARSTWTFGREALLELTHNWGTEEDAGFGYHNGNQEPRGFGHIGFTVPDVYAACERFEKLGVPFVKKPDEGKMMGVAFIRDPDGYWIEIVQADMMEKQARAAQG